MLKALFFSSLVLNLGLLLGRFSGFVREAFVASAFGDSAEADIVVLMLTVPDLLVNLLMAGALSAALIPEFSQHSERARCLLYQSCLLFGLAFFWIAAGFYWQADLLVSLLVPGFDGAQAEQAALAIGWVVWLIPLTVLTGVTTAYLHTKGRFAIPALGTLIINTTIIVGLLMVIFDKGTLQLLALFVLFGGGLRLISQAFLVSPGWSPILSLKPWLLNRQLMVRYGQALLSSSALLLLPVVARALASYQGEGSVAQFNYAIRLIEFPLAVAVTFLATVFFPKLSETATSNPSLHRALIRYGVQITIGFGVVAAITLYILCQAYVNTVYGYGNMQPDSLTLVAELTAIGLIYLPLQGLSVFLTSVFNARKDTRTPLLINIIGLLVFVVVSFLRLPDQSLTELMWSIVVVYGVICMMQLVMLKIGALSWLKILFARTFVLGMLIAVCLLVLTGLWIAGAALTDWLSLLLGGLVALLSLAIMALFNPELRSSLKARLKPR